MRRFESCRSDMGIKFDEGDEVRLKRNMEFGNAKIRKMTKGKIKKVVKKGFSKEYTVRWNGLNFDITHSAKDIDPCGDRAEW